MRKTNLLILCFILILNMFPFRLFSSEPDFNYPKDVLNAAEAQIASSAKLDAPKGGLVRMNGILKGLRALTEIDPEDINGRLAFLKEHSEAPNLTKADQAMMLAIQAKLLQQYQNSNRWKILRREVPGETSDPKLWDDTQFTDSIAELYARASKLAADTEVKAFIPEVLTEGNPEVFGSMVSLLHEWSGEKTVFSKDCTPGSAAFFYWLAQENEDATPAETMALYERYKDYEWSNYLLLRPLEHELRAGVLIPNTRENEENILREKFADLAKLAVKAHPKFPYNDYINERIKSVTAPSANVVIRSFIPVDQPFDITIKGYNAKEIYVDFCPVTLKNNLTQAKIKTLRPIQSLTYTPDSVYSIHETQTILTQPGTFVVRIKVNGESTYNYTFVEATPFIPFVLTHNNEAVAVATDYTTGAPVKGVNVSGKSNRKSHPLGTTDSNGVLRFSKWSGYDGWHSPLEFSYKAHLYNFDNDLNVWFRNPENPRVRTRVNVLTDRGIYHPGESVAWVAIVGTKDVSGKQSLKKGASVTVTFLDANNKEAGTAKVTTDAMGRADSTFQIPKDLLTGYYTLKAESEGQIGTTRIMVSDFKAPVFDVKIDSVVISPQLVTLKGLATTLSGMPVIDADVNLSVRQSAIWRTSDEVLYTSATRTGNDGRFEFEIAKTSIPQDYVDEYLTGLVKVTSTAAETAEISKCFHFGKPYILTIDKLGGNYSTATPFSFTVIATDANEQKVELECKWSLERNNNVVREGISTTGSNITLDLADLPAGDYELIAKALDSEKADDSGYTSFIFYNIEKNEVPGESPIFVPENQIKAYSDAKTAKVIIGTPYDKSYIYLAVEGEDGINAIRSSELERGFTTVEIPLVSETDENPLLICQRGGKTYIERIYIRKEEPKRLKIEVETFRDKVVPGERETWRMRITGPDANSSAAVATMYNHALDMLTTYRANIYFRFSESSRGIDYNSILNYTRDLEYIKHFSTKYTYPRISIPSLKYISQEGQRIYGGRRVLYRKAKADDDAIEEEYETDEVAVNTVMASAPAMMAAEGVTTDALEEKEVSFTGIAVANDSGPQAVADEFREPEVLQAFWMPRLVADDEGVVTIEFTVPNANTTWAFKMFGWTSELLTADLDAKVLASKPVMVQSAVPRYLRQGDRAVLRGTVFNNSEKEARINTRFEVFDPISGVVSEVVSDTLTLGAKGSGTVSVPVHAATDAASVGYRLKATCGDFSDGEQGVLPVLSSSQVVIESQEFYLDAKGAPVTLTAPKSKDANTTLQYCQNPIWTVVKALRGADWEDLNMATTTATQLGSAALAMHIVRTNPRISRVLAEWKSNPTEGALTSMLEKNSELKTLLLNQTPWVQAAKSNTERMEALPNVLDSTRCNYLITKATEALAKFQNADGGFRWAVWSKEESSEWTTATVLQTLGIANSFHALPAEVAGTVRQAFRWLENRASASKKDSWLRSQFALVATFFPDYTLTEAGRKVVESESLNLAKEWGKMNLSNKAYTAMILNYAGKRNVAESVIRSIEQYGKTEPGRGIEFPSVKDMRAYGNLIQAVATVTPGNPILDPMRQWVILQAQSSDDLGTWNPDYIISSVLLTGSVWSDMTSAQPISINGSTTTFTQAELGTGYLTASIAPGSVVTVSPTGVTPSYGSLVSVFSDPMTEIKAHKSNDLEISKRMMVQRDGQWVETQKFRYGEEVRVQLQIKSKRMLEYIAITDERPAGFEPTDQLPGWIWSDGIGFYRENRDASTRLFIGYLPKGTYSLTYSFTAATSGSFASGLATIQSQYDPALTAHSSGCIITIE